jgi:hypothetical protein
MSIDSRLAVNLFTGWLQMYGKSGNWRCRRNGNGADAGIGTTLTPDWPAREWSNADAGLAGAGIGTTLTADWPTPERNSPAARRNDAAAGIVAIF